MSSAVVQLLSSHLTELLAFSVTLLAILYLYLQHHFSYWKRHNIPYIKPNPIFGNFKEIFMFQQDPCTHFSKLYNHENAKGQPVVGLHVMNKPCLLIRHLELVKAVLIKDFNKFSNRYSTSDPHTDSLGSDNLFFSKNPMWREIRQKLTPVFTSGKIKQMFPLIEEIGRELDQHLCDFTTDQKSAVREIKEIAALYTTDVISSVAYGIRANSLNNPDGEFRKNGKRLFHFTRRRALELTSMFFFPALVKFFGFKVFSPETSVFLKNTINYVMEERVKSGTKRNDLIDVLIDFKAQAESEKDKKHFLLQRDCLIAQAAIFFSAGFETTSATISFILYELSKRQDLQQRLREEIREGFKACDGKLTYDVVQDMKYLNMVMQEVLRIYPPLAFLDRECTLPAGEKGYSLKPYCDFEIPQNMPIYVPMQSLHMDPEYFPDPEVFDPERFSASGKSKNNLNAYMPFGTGPHNCIGERFGILQAKVGLINFLRNHYVTPCEQSHKKMQLDPRAIIIQAKGGIYVNLVRDPLEY